MIEVSITYETITPESAEHGDFADSGFESESEFYTFRELVSVLRQRFTQYSQSLGPYTAWMYASEYSEPDYRTGEETVRSIHLKDKSKARYWIKALNTAERLNRR